MTDMAIDSVFIQSIEHRPKLQILEAQGIPVVDLSCLNSPPDSLSFQRLVADIGSACKKWGFFQVTNHGVPEDCRRRVERSTREFFGQPKEEKMKVVKNVKNTFGYHDTEHTKNVRDWKEVYDFLVENPAVFPVSDDPSDQEVKLVESQWPSYPADFREVCQEYTKEIKKLAYKLLELISASLGLAPDRLNGFFEGQISYTRLNYYPVCPDPHLVLGIGRHKDSGALTVITQDDVGGLEVKRKSDGEWIRVKPVPNAFVVNVGDIFQVWSNDKYESVEHRAMVNSEKERFTIPFFFSPAHHVVIEPLPELIDDQNPSKYKPYNWGKFRATRNRNNLRKLEGENIQIHHFKTVE